MKDESINKPGAEKVHLQTNSLTIYDNNHATLSSHQHIFFLIKSTCCFLLHIQMSKMGGVFALSFVLLLVLGNVVVAEEMLFSGENLNAGEFLENGPYRFIMQTDCNLVLYMNQTRALWSSRTDGRGTSCRATLQNDGNLVVFSGTASVWNSGTARGSNNYRLIVQSDGNVVIYGAALWATNTVQS